MSGYPGGPGESNGLDSLFAQLRQQQNKPANLEPSFSYYYQNALGEQPSTAQQPHGYHQPSVSSPVPTPPSHGPQPVHGSAIISPVETPQPRLPTAAGGPSKADRTSSLLNLLKFSQPSTSSPSQPAPIGTPLPPSHEPSMNFGGSDVHGQVSSTDHGRGGSDLLAALMGAQPKPAQVAGPEFATNIPPPQSSFNAAPASPPADTQAYLLQLLNQPKPSQTDSTPQLKAAKILTPPSQANSQDDVGELAQALEEASLHLSAKGPAAPDTMRSFVKEPAKEPASNASQGLFTYVNPFDQLAASSPRNRTPKAPTPAPTASNAPAIQILKHPRHDSPGKRKKAEKSAIPSPTYGKREQKLEPPSQQSSAPPTPLPDGRTPIEALIGIGASGGKTAVSDALNEVGDQVGRQVQEAIARVERDGSHASIEQDLRDMLAAKTEEELQETAEIAARDVKKELEKDENRDALDPLPAPIADAVRDIIDDAAQGHVADSWERESIDAEDKKKGQDLVKVYNFPMKPWIAITINNTDEVRPNFREEAVMDIARLKKEFDQIDRTLVTASGNFIVYGMSKNGGVRIIRQDDGKDARLFTETQDRIFSVVTSSSPTDLREAIIGTGVSGTVYWAVIKDGEGDHLDAAMPEMHGFALPPIQSHDTESPGGVLKTRARKSSAHPDFFAVGRGKYIHVIWPSVILKQSYLQQGKGRVVDTNKYLNHLSLKINTGKAGKDFTFSEDDTTIVSLDKSGRVKFWDVRSLTNPDALNNGSRSEHIEIKEPLITYTTTPASEKSWPTSVLFVDKLRPYQKGGPLRYLLVGMKQNHTLQLWDLALGKPVQEIHLPHGKESDAVCSVVYHAATGMIVVGHPTRNSIYLLHLSAPKYNLPKSITQAEYMEKIVTNSSTVLKPDSTAVISGMREYSFADKGVLRSLDILQNTTLTPAEGEAPTMFELYTMHSKGVTCLLIKQEDLGWTRDNKVVNPVEAEKAGVISIDNLKEIPSAQAPVSAELSAAPPAAPTQIAVRPAAKEAITKEPPKKPTTTETFSTPAKVEEKREPLPNGGTEKKKRRKATASAETDSAGPSSSQTKTIILDPSSHSRNGNISKASATATANLQGASQDISDGTLKSVENRLASEVKKHFGESLDSLYQDIKDDRRTQAAVADAKQDAMLRLVSSTLSDNIEATLGRIVTTSIQKSVLPAISDVALKAVKEQLGSKMNLHLSQSLPRELQKALPDAVGKALQQPQLLKLMSDSLANSVAFRVEEQFASIMQSVITPAFTNLALQTSQKVADDIQHQATEQIEAIEHQRHADSIKVEQLTQLVTGLTETISAMAAAQSEFQKRFLRQQSQSSESQHATHQTEGSTVSIMSPPNVPTAPVQKTPAEEEYDSMMGSIKQSMEEGHYEVAVVQWLQTRREQEFFVNYFSKLNPDFLRHLSPLLLLSLGATITINFDDQCLMQRIAWMEALLYAFQVRANAGDLDDQVRNLIPKIMVVYIQRVEHLFMRISNISAQDPSLKRLSMLVTAANRILELGNQPRLDSPAPRMGSGSRHY